MAKLVVCALFDSAIQAYTRPIFVQAIGQAVRSFNDEVNRQAADNQLNAHPEDFHLSLIGTWDEETGKFDQAETRVLARGQDVKEQPK